MCKLDPQGYAPSTTFPFIIKHSITTLERLLLLGIRKSGGRAERVLGNSYIHTWYAKRRVTTFCATPGPGITASLPGKEPAGSTWGIRRHVYRYMRRSTCLASCVLRSRLCPLLSIYIYIVLYERYVVVFFLSPHPAGERGGREFGRSTVSVLTNQPTDCLSSNRVWMDALEGGVYYLSFVYAHPP